MAAFREMHVSPAKHSFGKCDRQSVTDGRTDRQTDGRSLCVAMLRRRHNDTSARIDKPFQNQIELTGWTPH